MTPCTNLPARTWSAKTLFFRTIAGTRRPRAPNFLVPKYEVRCRGLRLLLPFIRNRNDLDIQQFDQRQLDKVHRSRFVLNSGDRRQDEQ